MSRGLGQLQRKILDLLESSGEFEIVLELAERAYGVEFPTASQYESTRRAVRGLVRRGDVYLLQPFERRRVQWTDGTVRWHKAYAVKRVAEARIRELVESGEINGSVEAWFQRGPV